MSSRVRILLSALTACLASAALALSWSWVPGVVVAAVLLAAAAVALWRSAGPARDAQVDVEPVRVGDGEADDMVDELLRHTERLKLRHFRGRRTAHNLTGLLSAACTNVDILGTMTELTIGSREPQVCLERLDRALERCFGLLDEFTKATAAAEFQPVHLHKMVRKLEHLRRIPSLEGCSLTLEPGRHVPPIDGNEDELRLMILGLTLASARSYEGGTGPILVRCGELVVEREHLDGALFGDQLIPSAVACVEVEDRGRPPRASEANLQDLSAILESLPEARRLGVEVAAVIVRAHCGAMRVAQESDGRVRVTAWFPLARTRHDPPTDAPLGEVLRRTSEILVVDDQPEVREATSVILRREGLTVRTAASGEAALALLEDPECAIGLVLLDVVMPGMDGIATYRAMRQRRADLPIILASGMPEDEVVRRMGGKRPTGYLCKPYRQAEIVEYLRMFMA